MNKVLDAALGIHPHALAVGARRLEVLAENMANADTPHYKARDIDFRSALAAEMTQLPSGGAGRAHAAHIPIDAGGNSTSLLYRTPNHPSLDGNTVDGDLEKAAFAEASIRYQASLDFLSMRIDGLRKALRGE